ncbi:DUF3560 domain-containing protein [Aeromonas sobria]|uniref:DUF3560 domain-containing protein n=1 Tax=Aeromonas sobria TaxID=646 RepID=UPI0011E02DD0|nr:DUF3560 domain-containing protein [Aeromonas sobria]
MSATLISMADFNAAKQQQQQQQSHQFVRRPVSVLVKWSESGAWLENETVSFADFEEKAAAVAIPYAGGGYQKTGITVSFDDGESYECRVDLSSSSEQGFTDHCLSMLDYYETEPGAARLEKCSETKKLIEFLRGVDFGTDAAQRVAADRQAGKAAEEQEEQRREAEKQAAMEARRLAQKENERLTDEWRAALVIPEDAKAVIIARKVSLDVERSDPYADYYRTQNDETVILAWSKHTRDLFSEMRKAVKNYGKTAFLADPELSEEHREKYSMGAGYYLTEKRFIHEGWIVEKQSFWGAATIEQKAKNIPRGLIAIPGYTGPDNAAPVEVVPVEEQAAPVEVVQVEEQAAPVEVVPVEEQAAPVEVVPVEEQAAPVEIAQVEEQAPAQIKPKFSAKQAGGLWSVTIQQGEQVAQFDGITAASMPDACRIAWAMLTQPTPPDDDPSGEPLPVEQQAEPDSQPDHGEQGAETPTLTRAQLLGDYSERVEAKRGRLQVRAIKANQQSDQRWGAAHSAVAGIVFGQPILVGHHSEKKHRRALARSDQAMRQSIALDNKAKHLESRAASVGQAGIASDDPTALEQLRAKLAEREEIQDAFKKANKAKRGSVPAWRLSNNNAEIRRLRQRIEEIQNLHQAAPIEREGDGWRMFEDDGRITIQFDGKPAPEIRQQCRGAGFVWSPSRCAWVRKVTARAVREAERLADKLPA